MRVFGARSRHIGQAYLVELVSLGALSGLIGAVGANCSAAILAAKVFGLDYQVNYLSFIVGIGGGVLLVGGLGLWGMRQFASQPPIAILRKG